MARAENLTAETLRQLLDYDPETGILRWKKRTPEFFEDTVRRDAEQICNWWNKRFAGKIAGSLNKNGYIALFVLNKWYRAHRIIWLWMTGSWPTIDVDHRDLSKSNNRWGNLREATQAQNRTNRNLRPDNTSGLKGVCWFKPQGKWRAAIQANKKRVFLGYFDTKDEAHAAYCDAAKRLHGEFARME